MIQFENDYSEGAHERILARLAETNMEQTVCYGEDPYCEEARELIQTACQAPGAIVHFLVGGTQTNTTVIAAVLRPHQGVIAHQEGHVSVHESGAIEATGHKVLTVAGTDGKINADQVKQIYESHIGDASYEHMVQPKMVYISNPTECGTLYTKEELKSLSTVCRECGLYLYLDGARLGYGLMAEGNDVTLEDIAACCDVFYIGGTKVGALFGEAVVITNKALQEDFRYLIKQRGGMLAKGRLLGIQFAELFRDGLYQKIGAHGVKMAMLLKEAFRERGYHFMVESATNQQFPIMKNSELAVLKEKYSFSFWQKVDEEHSAVRFCTSWATKEADVRRFIDDLGNN